MSQTTTDKPNMALFWGCFIALICTAYAFISRMILCGGQFITDHNRQHWHTCFSIGFMLRDSETPEVRWCP